MNQNIEQNNMNQQQPRKSDALKITLIIVFSVLGVILVGIIGFVFLVYTIFHKSIEVYEDAKENVQEHWENYDSSEEETSGNDNQENEPIISDDEQPENEIPITSFNNITSLSYQDFKDKINNSETFVIVISQTGCGHCVAYKPIFNQVLESNNIQGYDLDLHSLTKNEYKEFLANYYVSGTPTTLVFTNGILEEEKLVGTKNTDEITAFLQKYSLIK